MELHTQDIANVILLRVEGRIDHLTAKSFEDALLPQLTVCTGEAKKALMDLSGVPFMSSAGLRVLMLAAKQCQRQHGSIVLAALPALLQEVFKISRFDLLFKSFDTVHAALEAISPDAAALYSPV
jgi:anti-sigma B factor antagonist/stage II sporulation protein AA (anti-sigma F factor antagonist)